MKKLTIISLLLISCFGFCSFRKDVNTGNKLFYKKNYEQAIEKYNSAEVKKPDSAIVYFNRANAFYKQQLYEQAIKEYQKALGLTKNKNLKSKIFFNLGNSYLKIGDTHNAKEAYKQGLLNNPDDEDIKYNLQYALVQLQQNQSQKQKESSSEQKKQEDKDKKQEKQKKYMSEQDLQRLLELARQQQTKNQKNLKDILKPQKPQLPAVEKDW